MGQTLGCTVQFQRLPTPSRALCLETHQTRPCPRNHRPRRVRTWPRVESGRTTAGRLTSPTSPPALRAAVGIHSFATRQIGSARCCALQLPRYTASRSSWQLVCMCCRARMACASRLLCDNRSRRRQAPTLGVLPGCRAQLISPQAASNLARDPPTDPRRSLFLACATSAGHGCAAWPRPGYAAITHELPGSRPATPTKPASPTPCGGPGDGRWVAGRRPCQARGNTSSWL
jgi:hypothetical protein